MMEKYTSIRRIAEKLAFKNIRSGFVLELALNQEMVAHGLDLHDTELRNNIIDAMDAEKRIEKEARDKEFYL